MPNPKTSKQLTLDSLPIVPQKEHAKTTAKVQEKWIIITEIDTLTKEDELALKISFKLLPSNTAFSKVKADLWFGQPTNQLPLNQNSSRPFDC